MPIELSAHTEAGARLVAIAETLYPQLATRAAAHDQNRSYPFEAIDALKAAGYFAAPVPVELGGLGVSSAHDLVSRQAVWRAATRPSRSASACTSSRCSTWHAAARSRSRPAPSAPPARFAASLEQIAREHRVLAAAISERGQDLTRPSTRATRTESGWRIDGRKLFCTMSPAATDLYVAVTYTDRRAPNATRTRWSPPTRPVSWSTTTGTRSGCAPLAATRSRSSTSSYPSPACAAASEQETRFRTWNATSSPGCSTPRRRSGSPSRPTNSPATGSLARINGDARPRMQAAENAIDLAASRGVISRAATLIDEHRTANPTSDGSPEQLAALFAEAQAAKTFVNEAAARIVDRALILSGGAGYLNGSALARAYRDVKAGSFMHPLGANRAYDYLAHVALGEASPLH